MGTPPARLPDLLAVLVRQLRQGRPGPGCRFPTKHPLALELGVSPVTAQRLLHQLQEWGYLESRPRHGTSVALLQPHRNRFALALYDPQERLSSHCAALARAAQELSNDHGTWEIFYGAADRERLKNALALGRLAGVYIPLASAFRALDFSHTSCPVIGLPPVAGRHDRIAFEQEVRAFLHHAAQQLLLRGHTRLAVLADDLQEPDFFLRTIAAVQAELGFTFQPRWLQGGPLARPTWMAQILELLDAEDGPDGLIVLDDHFLGPLEAHFTAHPASRIRAVVQVNTPHDYAVPAPNISLLGWDMREILTVAAQQFRAHLDHGWPLVRQTFKPQLLPHPSTRA